MARRDERLFRLLDVLLTLREPVMRLRQRKAHEKEVVFRCGRRVLPGLPRGFEAAAPDQEFTLGLGRFPELLPAAEDRLVGDLGVGFAGLGRGGDEKPIRVVGKLGDEPPFLVRKFLAGRAAAESARCPCARSRA